MVVDRFRKPIKIVCTLGPSTASKDTLVQMIDAGMNVARFNFSHGDHASHLKMLEMLRQAMALRPAHHVAVMLDTKGPEIRTGMLEEHKSVKLVEGDELEITSDYSFVGNARKVAMSYDGLNKLREKQIIKMSDDTIRLEVIDALPTGVRCRITNNAELGEKKNVNIPGAHLDVPTILEKDKDDLVNFGVRHHVDMIALSFCRTARDVLECREVMGPEGRDIKVVAKIEDWIGLENVQKILEVTDGVMVARGDLGMELETEKIFMAQKWIIREANIHGVPVITATQMMESMITNPRPTRAECTDVANAVLDGSDAVMLSGETANGKHPPSAVRIMASIAVEAARCINYSELNMATRNTVMFELGDGRLSPEESVASSAAKTALDVGAKIMIVPSETGHMARLAAKYRPGIPILMVTSRDCVARWIEGVTCSAKGVVYSLPDDVEPEAAALMAEAAAMNEASVWGWIKPRDHVVVLVGAEEGLFAHFTPYFKVVEAEVE